MRFIHQPSTTNRLGEFLSENLGKSWPKFRAAIAFVKQSGTRHILEPLSAFSKTGQSELIIGIDHRGTSKEGLEDLLSGVGRSGRVVVFHNPIASTFHPKIYLFQSEKNAEVLIGSGNLTEGGLFTNYEAAIHLSLDLSVEGDASILQSIETVLDDWADTDTGTARILEKDFLTKLVARGFVPLEALIAPNRDDERDQAEGREEDAPETAEGPELEPFFSARGIARAPTIVRKRRTSGRVGAATEAPTAAETETAFIASKGFVMTLQRTDVGTGQVTTGASRRSPEIFIPLSARNDDPAFWGWPDSFTEDANKSGKFDRFGVRIRVGTNLANVNMMTWPDKHDFRLRSEALRSAGNIGDILRIEQADPASGFDYFAVVIPPGATEYPIYRALCTHTVRNSSKLYGYY